MEQIVTDTASNVPNTKPGIAERVLGKQGTPVLWGLAAKLLAGIVLAMAAAAVLGQSDVAAYAIVPAALTILTATLHPGADSLLRGAVLGLLVAVLAALGLAVSFLPLLAGLVAFVVFYASTAAKVLPQMTIEPDMVALGYFMAAIIGNLGQVGSGAALSVLLVGVVAVGAGLAVEGTLKLLRSQGAPATAPAQPRPGRPSLAASVRMMLDLHQPVIQFALVRGIVLGLGIALLSLRGADRPVAWIVIAIFSVMRPIPHDTLSLAGLRIAATFVGVIIIGLAGAFLPGQVALSLGVAGLLVTVLFLARSPFLVAVGGTMLSVVVAGAPEGQYVLWAGTRFIETLIGGAIAIAVIFLVIPILDRIFAGTTADAA